MSRPCGAAVSPRSARSLSTIAVLDIATSMPANTACGSVPRYHHVAIVTNAVVPTICGRPTRAIVGSMTISRESENSRPTVNSSTTTPISASASTTCRSETSDSP